MARSMSICTRINTELGRSVRSLATIVVPSKSPLESLQLTFRVTCHSATRFALPVTFNAYSKVFVGRTGRTLRPIPYFRVPTDPRIVIDVKSSGSELVVVHLPTLWGTLF